MILRKFRQKWLVEKSKFVWRKKNPHRAQIFRYFCYKSRNNKSYEIRWKLRASRCFFAAANSVLIIRWIEKSSLENSNLTSWKRLWSVVEATLLNYEAKFNRSWYYTSVIDSNRGAGGAPGSIEAKFSQWSQENGYWKYQPACFSSALHLFEDLSSIRNRAEQL